MTTTSSNKKTQHRAFTGEVVSDKGNKTIVVRVTRAIWHPKYRRQYRVSKRFSVHDEHNAHHIGDTVRFVECRPISKAKRWRVLGQSKSSGGTGSDYAGQKAEVKSSE